MQADGKGRSGWRMRGLVGALMAAAMGAAASAGEPDRPSTLGTPQQLKTEALALRLLASAPVQKELKNLTALYAKDPVADMPGGRATLQAAAEAMAMHAAMLASNQDGDRPALLWNAAAAHEWDGMRVPRSGIVQDNPDNVYRIMPVDGEARYEIRGKVLGQPPTQETFVLHDFMIGAVKRNLQEHDDEVSSVALDQLPLGPDGSFLITIDSTPANGRPNHLQTRPASRKGFLFVRDTLSNWAVQNPTQLEVRRVGGPPVAPAPTEAALANLAAEFLSNMGPYWLAWEHRVFFSRPVNTFSLDFARVTGWGFLKCGAYQFGEDEALVFTLERRGAGYLAAQAAELWGPATDYVDRTGSLNQSQARPDADGAYTFVIAATDPGAHNWLDPGGLRAGTFCARWQKLPTGASAADAVRSMQVVKLKDLKTALPAGALWLTPDERRAQLTRRAADYARRLSH